jgi:crotonobetainyl-CoA:carnitine CoA-transferase CaiB-like acyl-CoA transferase
MGGHNEPLRWWRTFAPARAIARRDLETDPRFANSQARVSNRHTLLEALGADFTERDAADWLVEMGESGLPCGPINTLADVFAHPQTKARDLALAAEHPTTGWVWMTGFPYLLSEMPAQVRLPPGCWVSTPTEVLTNVLGYSTLEVDEFRELAAD